MRRLTPATCLRTMALSAFLLHFDPLDSLGQQPVPDELREKLSELSAEQYNFIVSGDASDFVSQRQLEHELATRDPADLRAFIDDLMSVATEITYDPERDMGAIPLNTASRYFEADPMPTPVPLRDFERSPGPFSVSRYLFPQSGVPTFGGAAVAIWPEDLVAGDVDVAIVGVPNNMSSGRRDSFNGPGEMRALDTIATTDVQSLVNPLHSLSIVDYGNFRIDPLSTERNITHVTKMVAETAATGAIPMLVGGDTSMLYPGVKGVADTHGIGRFGLLHFSAHPDAEMADDHTVADRSAVFLLVDQGIVAGNETIQVGLRGPAVNAESLQWLRDKGVRYHTMAEIQRRGFANVLKRVRREVDRGPDSFFVSIDVSAIDPADMPGAGRVASNGLSMDEVFQTIRYVCAAKDIVGFEITDLAPMMDLNRTSVMHANAVLNACLIGIAVRKEGLDPDYVHPLALDHGQR